MRRKVPHGESVKKLLLWTWLQAWIQWIHLSLFRRHLCPPVSLQEASLDWLASLGLDPGAWLRAHPLLYKPLHLPCRPQLNLKYYGDKNKFEIQNSISVWLTKTMVVFIINHYGSADIVKDQYSLTRRSRTFTSDSYLSSRCTVYPSY